MGIQLPPSPLKGAQQFPRLFGPCLLCAIRFSLDYFILVLFAFVVLGLVSSLLSQRIGWDERLRNELFCVERDTKP